MNRRTLISTIGATVAGAASTALAQAKGAQSGNVTGNAAADCLKTGFDCIAFCNEQLAKGDKSLAACAQTTTEMVAAAQALVALAHLKSAHLKPTVAGLAPIFDACEKACRKHESHHAICKACADCCKKLLPQT